MFQVSSFASTTLQQLKAEYAIHHGDGMVHVDIIDIATQNKYARASAVSGASEADVLDAAVKKALGSERPRPPLEQLRDLQAENAKLQAEIEALRAGKPAAEAKPKPKSGKGGKDKTPPGTNETTPPADESEDGGSNPDDDKFPDEK